MPRQPHPTPHSTPAIVVKTRGPMRSINQPCSGWTHVWKRMKYVKASWISESFQPVPC